MSFRKALSLLLSMNGLPILLMFVITPAHYHPVGTLADKPRAGSGPIVDGHEEPCLAS